ncbi:hypothetical protein ACIRL0_15680 [Streptomyces sp. NPDC102365]|uniref:hypothetical protein n=1 Tax=Streptomyces sp. NPDC102365 TaxID=3366162 RepID=UPI00382175F0
MALRVVVDACVGKEASEANLPRSRNSRLVLSELLKQRIPVDFTPEVEREWNKHASIFSIKWRYQMVTRKLIVRGKDKQSSLLRKKIQSSLPDPYDVAALLKDVHLLEIGLSQGSGIISSDDRSGRLAKVMADSYAPLARVQWVSPHKPEGTCLGWVEGKIADADIGRLGSNDAAS